MKLDLTNAKTSSFEPLPKGDYNLVCKKAEVKKTNAGDGEYIKCEFLVDGTSRRVFHNFNIVNKSQKAVEIGLGQLKDFLTHAGHGNPDSLESEDELLGLEVAAHVKIDGEWNQVSYFKKEAKQAAGTSGVGSIPF